MFMRYNKAKYRLLLLFFAFLTLFFFFLFPPLLLLYFSQFLPAFFWLLHQHYIDDDFHLPSLSYCSIAKIWILMLWWHKFYHKHKLNEMQNETIDLPHSYFRVGLLIPRTIRHSNSQKAIDGFGRIVREVIRYKTYSTFIRLKWEVAWFLGN